MKQFTSCHSLLSVCHKSVGDVLGESLSSVSSYKHSEAKMWVVVPDNQMCLCSVTCDVREVLVEIKTGPTSLVTAFLSSVCLLVELVLLLHLSQLLRSSVTPPLSAVTLQEFLVMACE